MMQIVVTLPKCTTGPAARILGEIIGGADLWGAAQEAPIRCAILNKLDTADNSLVLDVAEFAVIKRLVENATFTKINRDILSVVASIISAS